MPTALWITIGILATLVIGFWFFRNSITVNHVMSAYSKDAVDAARSHFATTLDFTAPSITALDQIVGKFHDAYAAGDVPPANQLEQHAKIWGAYLGETIRRQHGGEWSIPTEGPFAGAYTLTLPNSIQLSPPARVMARIIDGPTDCLISYYQAVPKTC